MSMTNPSDIVDALVSTLQSIDALTAIIPVDRIYPYYQGLPGQNNLDQTLLELKPPAMLVAWRGTKTGRSNRRDTIFHDFAFLFHQSGRASDIFFAIRESVVPFTGLKFKLSTILDSCNPVDDLACTPRSVFISQKYGIFDYIDITFSLVERGIDD